MATISEAVVSVTKTGGVPLTSSFASFKDYEKTMNSYIGKTISGAEFNKLIGDEPMIKFTTETENHNGFQFKTGLNIDNRPFYNKGSCKQGGIYFTSLYYFHTWVTYGSKKCVHYRYVTVPDDARIYIEQYKIKADKIVLSDRMPFNSLSTLWSEPKYLSTLYRSHYYSGNYQYMMTDNRFKMPEEYFIGTTSGYAQLYKYIPQAFLERKDFRMKLYDVNAENFKNLEKYRTPSECLDAITSSPQIFRHLTIKEKLNPEIYTIALASEPSMLSTIRFPEQTSEVCNYAFSHNPIVYEYIAPEFRTIDMRGPAVAAKPENLKLIPLGEHTDDLIMTAVQKDGLAIQYADYQTYAIAYEAVKQNGAAFKYLENKRPLTIIREADGTVSQEYDDTLITTAVETYPRAVLEMKSFVEAPFVKALERDYNLIREINRRWITPAMKNILFRRDLKMGFRMYPTYQPTEEMIRDAISVDRKNASYISSDYKYSQDLAEFIFNEFPELRNRVLEYMPREYHENLVKEDPLAALFSDASLEAAEHILG